MSASLETRLKRLEQSQPVAMQDVEIITYIVDEDGEREGLPYSVIKVRVPKFMGKAR